MPLPRIAFCTTCKGRAQHIKLTLPKNLADNADYPNAIFVLVNYSSPDDLAAYAATIQDPRFIFRTYRHEGAFRMAHAKNLAHRLGIAHGADILVNMDADNYTGPGFATYIATLFDLYGPKTFLWGRMVQRCNQTMDGDALCILPRGHEVRHSSEEQILQWLYPENERPHVRGISGRLVVPKEAFLRTGGYDEKMYDNWGPDDRDFNLRMQRLGFRPREIRGRFLEAQPHSEAIRFKEYPHVKTLSPEEWYELEKTAGGSVYTATVGFGASGCGTVESLDGVQESLLPYPTRIFGIGFHKTGTTSLAEALRSLGYDTGHWTNPRWAREIWEEIRAYGKSLTLEHHDAITDFPAGLLWKELDAAYPGSKFVLTTRPEDEWLASVRVHFSDKNKWRSSWENDAFTHRLHHEVYARKKFDEDIMRARFRKHNAEVREYFKDRHADLLVIEGEADWPALCNFLGRTVPAAPYPRANAR